MPGELCSLGGALCFHRAKHSRCAHHMCMPSKVAERCMAAEQEWLARLRMAPSIVRAHYQRMLLEWTVSTLAKFSSQPAADDSRATKRRRLDNGTILRLLNIEVPNDQCAWPVVRDCTINDRMALCCAILRSLLAIVIITGPAAGLRTRFKAETVIVESLEGLCTWACMSQDNVQGKLPCSMHGSRQICVN